MAKSTAFKPKLPKEIITPGTPEVETPVNEEVVSSEDTQETLFTEENEGDASEETTESNDTAQEEEVSESEIEEKEEEKTSNVSFVNTDEKVVPDTNVKVRLSREYSCSIGGKKYFFEKDKIATVPNNVKVVLSEEENLLKPLQ
jgi:hypothetical protein